MYAVFVEDRFDSVYEWKEAAKNHAASVRKHLGKRAFVKKLMKREVSDLDL